MDFSVYSSQDGPEAVERGLSAGEARQALLDRFKSAMKKQDVAPSMSVLFARLFSLDEMSEFTHWKEAYPLFEERLYELADEELAGTSWELPSETIYVEGS